MTSFTSIEQAYSQTNTDFGKMVKHARIAAPTKSAMWDGDLGMLAKGAATMWRQESRDAFADACYSYLRADEVDKANVFRTALQAMEARYEDIFTKRNGVLAALQTTWDHPEFITLTHRMGNMDNMATQYRSYSKAELIDHIQGKENAYGYNHSVFMPRDYGMWKQFDYDMYAFKQDVCDSEMGQKAWDNIRRFASIKRVELMDGERDPNNVSCYFLAQALVKQACTHLAFWKPILEWKIDKIRDNLVRNEDTNSHGQTVGNGLYAGGSDSTHEAENELAEVVSVYEDVESDVKGLIELCEQFAGHMHKVIQPSFAYAHYKDDNDNWRPIYNKMDAITHYIKRNQDKEMLDKEKEDAMVLDTIDAALSIVIKA